MIGHQSRVRQVRARMRILGAAIVMGAALAGIAPASASATPVTVGYRDFSYSGTSAPTGQKPQSKLWFNDGIWWGNLFNSSSKTFHIYRLDWATQTWSDTGTQLDTRSNATGDVKWDGTHLYEVSAVYTTSVSGSAKVWRFSYSTGSKSYSLDAGFPVTVSSGGAEAVVLETDTAGVAWVTFTQAKKVFVTHSVGAAQTTWIAPYVIPLPGAANLTSDDISSIIAYDGKIGVMWSNQNPSDWAMYWGTHVDGAGDSPGDWVANTAVKQTEYADDHLNLKQLTADPSGRVYAVTKTSLNNVSAPLILVLVLKPNGNWERHTFGTVSDNHTRAMLLLDSDHRTMYVFAASPCCSGGIIYMKSSSIDNINFPSGKGTPFIQSSSDTTINNPTSTKQNLTSATGLLVIAGDDHSHNYLHNRIDLGPADTTPPDTVIDSGPSGTESSTSATFAFHSTEANSSFQCKLDSASFAPCSSPTTYSGLANGSHAFQVKATDLAGNTDPTPASRTWTVDTSVPDTNPPTVSLTAPANGATVGGTVQMTATASDDVAVDHVDFLVNGSVVATDSTSPYAASWSSTGTPDGAATITAHAVDTSLNAADDSHGVTLDNTPPDTVIDSGPSGTVESSTATFTFHSTEAGSSSQCKLDTGSFAACTSPTTYNNLANGDHTFQVRATDPPGNTDPSPASQSWTVNVGTGSIFSDGFESGDFSAGGWTRTVGGDGTAIVQSTTVNSGSFAAQLSETANTGSVSYIRRNLNANYVDLTVAGDIRIQQEGASGGNVPIFRVFDSANTRLMSLYRQNLSGNSVWVGVGSNHYSTTGQLPLSTWGHFELHLITAGTGTSTVEVRLNGTLVYQSTTLSLGSAGVRSIQIGNETSRQTFTIVADNILVTG